VIVGRSDDCKIETVGQLQYAAASRIELRQPAGRRVGELDGARGASGLSDHLRHFAEPRRHGDEEDSLGRKRPRCKRERGRVHGPNEERPVTLDGAPQHVQVLRAVSRLDAGKERRAVASSARIARLGGRCASEAPMVGHERHVEPRGAVPRPVLLGPKPGTTVPGRCGVAVEVDRHYIRAGRAERSHRTRGEAGRIYGDDGEEQHPKRSKFAAHLALHPGAHPARASPEPCAYAPYHM